MALGISKEGTLYGISLEGDLYSISTADGKETLVGSTGVTVKDSYGNYYQQSGEIDQKTNTFYWASIDQDGKSVLYTVDLATGRANKIGDMPAETQVFGTDYSCEYGSSRSSCTHRRPQVCVRQRQYYGSHTVYRTKQEDER